jgi:hypothetical protein
MAFNTTFNNIINKNRLSAVIVIDKNWLSVIFILIMIDYGAVFVLNKNWSWLNVVITFNEN